MRTPLDDRGPGIDLFDDPPWDTRRKSRRTPLDWLGHVGFALFVMALGLIGLLVVAAIIGFFVLVAGFHFSLGSINVPPPAPPSSYGMDVVVSADGSRLYVTEPAADRVVALYAGTGATLADIAVGDTPSGLALSPNGAQLWVVDTTLSSGGIGSGDVTVISTATNAVVGTVPVGPGPIDVAFSPDGHWAYVTNYGVLDKGSVEVINTATLTVEGTITAPASSSVGPTGWNPTSVAVSPDGRQLWVSSVADSRGSSTPSDVVTVFTTTTNAEVAEIPVGIGPYFMVLSHDGRYAYVADKSSCDVREIDTATFAVVSTVRWPSAAGCPFGLVAGPTDNLVYTVTGSDYTFNEPHAGDSFGSVNFTSSRAVVAGTVGTDPVTVALSPDATTAYVVDADRPVVDLVDPTTGVVRATVMLPTAPTAPKSPTAPTSATTTVSAGSP